MLFHLLLVRLDTAQALHRPALWVFKMGDSQVGSWAKPMTASLKNVQFDAAMTLDGELIIYDQDGANPPTKVGLQQFDTMMPL
jgi:hypothetical protein